MNAVEMELVNPLASLGMKLVSSPRQLKREFVGCFREENVEFPLEILPVRLNGIGDRNADDRQDSRHRE